ncbi:MAG: hypothetical protein OXE57_00525 [Alphaproteobacteria bacterium]|nr:hypothetical protein [Alphaproteobacteria bacterium]
MAGRLRRGTRRGAALPLGALFLTVAVVVVLAAWERRQEALRLAEIDRERGRIWAMTCTAVHRAAQSGRVTAAGVVTPAQLKGWSLLPAGLGTVGRAGGTVAAASYGAVMVDGVPMAACALSGPELSFRAPALLAGAVMGGLDRVGAVGGESTAMHGRLAAVQTLLGPLPAGSLFATADYGVGHAEDRLHRRPIGGRPELARMETDFVFGPNAGAVGQALLPAGEIESPVAVVAGEDCRNAALADDRRCFEVRNARNVDGVDIGANREGRVVLDPLVPASGRVETGGNVTVGRPGQPGSMAFGGHIPATAFRADGGFRFGHAGVPAQAFNIPQLLSVGTGLSAADTALAVAGEAAAGSLDVAGGNDARGPGPGPRGAPAPPPPPPPAPCPSRRAPCRPTAAAGR